MLKNYLIKFKEKKGEIAVVLTVISMIIMIFGVFAGSKIGKINNTQSKAAESGHCTKGAGGGTCEPVRNNGCYSPPTYNSGCCYWERCNDQGQCIDETNLATKAPSYFSCGGGIYGCNQTNQCEKCVIDARNLIPLFASNSEDTSCSSHKALLTKWKDKDETNKKQYNDSMTACKINGCKENDTNPYNPEGPTVTPAPKGDNKSFALFYLKPVINYTTKDTSENPLVDGIVQFEQITLENGTNVTTRKFREGKLTLTGETQEYKGEQLGYRIYKYDTNKDDNQFILIFITSETNTNALFKGKWKISKDSETKGFAQSGIKACYPELKTENLDNLSADLKDFENGNLSLETIKNRYIKDWNNLVNECKVKNNILITYNKNSDNTPTPEAEPKVATANETFKLYIDKFIRNEISTEQMSAFISQLTRWPGMQTIPCDYLKGECVYKPK